MNFLSYFCAKKQYNLMGCIKQFLVFVVCTITLHSYSQNIEFTYDDSGNRIQRLVIILNPPKVNINKTEDTQPSVVFKDVKVSPNPTKGMVYFENPLNEGESYTFVVLNSSGNIIKNGKSHDDSFSVDLSNYPVGFYVVKVYGKKFNTNIKIIKI